MAAEDFPPGTLIDGRYNIRERLGQGGMGTVYRAVDTKVGNTVALKLVAGGGSEKSKEDRRMRFAREIIAINEVRSPNVVHIQDFGFHRDTPYMVMDFLEGSDLAAILRQNDEPLAIEYAVDIMLSVCAAIRACHAKRVIHRDLKPGNIMIVRSDAGAGWEVRVVDFGISKTPTTSDLTQDGKIVGTPHFLSPEQLDGKAGPESDQYAIGVLLYVCLTKRHPYADLASLQLVRAIEKGKFDPPRALRPEIPEELQSVLLKAMRLAPGDRHESVFELGRELLAFASPLGRQFWKRYYETPTVARPANDAKMSAVGISVVHRLAEGHLKPSTATVEAHYQSTTAVSGANSRRGTEDTMKEVATTVAKPATDAPTEMTLHTPTGWRWQERSIAAAAASRDGEDLPPPRRRSSGGRVAVAVAGGALILVAAFAALRASRGSHEAARANPAAAVVESSAVPVSAVPVVQTARPETPPPLPTLPPPEREPQVRAPEPPVADAASPKRLKRHAHARASKTAAATGEYLRDPAGNLIPPP